MTGMTRIEAARNQNQKTVGAARSRLASPPRSGRVAQFAPVALCVLSLGGTGCGPGMSSDGPRVPATGGVTGGANSGGTGSGGATGSGGRTGGSGGVAQTSGSAGSGTVTGSGGASATGTGGAPGRSGTGGVAATGGAVGTGGSAPPSQPNVFGQCRFHFGTLDTKARNNAPLKAQIDMFTPGWAGQSDTFNMASVCTNAKAGGALAGTIPTVVSYIIAFAARRDQGLQDCNVSGITNLCKYGATYLRAHLEDRIIPLYSVYAKGFAAACGATTPMIWLMEPDYYQYSAGGDANALTPAEAGQIMGRLVATVRQSMPNAIFSLDISPWIPNNGRDWYSNFNMNDFSFINTSGGGTDADSKFIRTTDSMTWAGVHQVTGKPILADTGYGVAGSPTGPDPKWDVVANINARIADGVVGITQYNPTTNWGDTIAQVRPQLTAIPCN
jgi:hypothetical protein